MILPSRGVRDSIALILKYGRLRRPIRVILNFTAIFSLSFVDYDKFPRFLHFAKHVFLTYKPYNQDGQFTQRDNLFQVWGKFYLSLPERSDLAAAQSWGITITA